MSKCKQTNSLDFLVVDPIVSIAIGGRVDSFFLQSKFVENFLDIVDFVFYHCRFYHLNAIKNIVFYVNWYFKQMVLL